MNWYDKEEVMRACAIGEMATYEEFFDYYEPQYYDGSGRRNRKRNRKRRNKEA